MTLKERLYDTIFGTDSRAGQTFDLLLIAAILCSVAVLLLNTVEPLHRQYGSLFFGIEWFFTVVFTLEFLTRLYCSPNRRAYLFSFYGIVDLLSILPTYLALMFPGAQQLLVIRLLRVLRIFRILKLLRYLADANLLFRTLAAARRKIVIFGFSVITVIVIFGSLMYVIEGPQSGFTSLPKSIYWAIVTITTVGYGDITPQTSLGQFVAALAMFTSYAIIAIPTGIFSAELIQESQRQRRPIQCSNCERGSHEQDSSYCRFCGAELPKPLE
ncbi:voltage-gated potassium channel [Litorivivens lipolytica]|uniref:Voltage-gated potassium channel n=1 Tax=Litorivivens lipolytica TaxID=1524264 RepID=A0A7W4W2Y2_9GAMM|nr:ion transporter [Litorivivens lipolytica]MBB3046183.1 voltage-gated potassium channel [Litorivivens lipolytica]